MFMTGLFFFHFIFLMIFSLFVTMDTSYIKFSCLVNVYHFASNWIITKVFFFYCGYVIVVSFWKIWNFLQDFFNFYFNIWNETRVSSQANGCHCSLILWLNMYNNIIRIDQNSTPQMRPLRSAVCTLYVTLSYTCIDLPWFDCEYKKKTLMQF